MQISKLVGASGVAAGLALSPQPLGAEASVVVYSTTPPVQSNIMYVGEVLQATEQLTSGCTSDNCFQDNNPECEGKVTLNVQADGNLVLYQTKINGGGRQALWSTHTDSDADVNLILQSDGNLVLQTDTSEPLWSAHTENESVTRLLLQCDCDLVLYAGDTPIWSSQTSCLDVSTTTMDPCYVIEAVEGSWVPISSSSADQSVSYQVGVISSGTATDSATWGAAVTASVEAGFDVFGVSASVSVSGTVSDSLSQSYSSTFSMTSTTTYVYEFDAGVVWQWEFDITSGCGTATASGHDLTLTPNALNGPCCLPGMFVDITDANGACLAGTPDLCGREDTSTSPTSRGTTPTVDTEIDLCMCAGSSCEALAEKMSEGASLQELDKTFGCNCQACDDQDGTDGNEDCTWWVC